MQITNRHSAIVDKRTELFDFTLGVKSRILIADDDAIARRVLEATLCSYGFEVIATSNGREVCRALETATPPPLVILDLMMPEMDGLEVCKWIRASTRLQHTYVILLTSRNSSNDIATGLFLGSDDYVIKPFDQGELLARIQVGLRVLALQQELAAKVCACCGGLVC